MRATYSYLSYLVLLSLLSRVVVCAISASDAAPSDDLQAPALADLSLGVGYTSVAFVPRADDWDVGLRSFFVPAFEAGGGEVVYQEPYPPEATSFDDVVSEVIANNQQKGVGRIVLVNYL